MKKTGIGKPSIHAFVISWSGMDGHARAIAAALEPEADYLTVIHSDAQDRGSDGAGDWLLVPDSWFYGIKFLHSIEHNKGEVMLHITGDADCDDWPGLLRRCRDVHVRYPELAVWAPDIDHSDWHLPLVSMGRLDDSTLVRVSQTDSIVWSLRDSLLPRMRGLDYQCNNLGWGIDWFAISHAYSRGLWVLRDLAVKVDHPQSSGYDSELAESQMEEFLVQMEPRERACYRRLRDHSTWERVRRKPSLPRRFAAWLTKRVKGT